MTKNAQANTFTRKQQYTGDLFGTANIVGASEAENQSSIRGRAK